MTDLSLSLLSGTIGLVALAIVSLAALRGWGQWVALRREELSLAGRSTDPLPAPTTTSRIEIADLRERVRKLEAIAAGVDL